MEVNYMKKIVSVLGLSLGLCLIVGCGKPANSLDLARATGDSSLILSTGQVVATEKPANLVLYTDKKDKSLKRFLKSKSHVCLEQTSASRDGKEEVLSESTTTVDADCKSKVTFVTDVNGKLYADDLKKDTHYTYKKGKWYEDSGKTTVIDWDLKKYTDVYKLYRGILSGNELPLNSEGERSEGYEYYEVKQELTDDSLQGVDYDKLTSKTITYIFNTVNGYEPVSVISKVGFLVGGEQYYCTTTIQFTALDNKKLKMPALDVTAEEAKEKR